MVKARERLTAEGRWDECRREIVEMMERRNVAIDGRLDVPGEYLLTIARKCSVGRRDRLLELDEVERRLKPFGRRYLGVRAIPLDALVGTDSRASSFTRGFRPLLASSRDRLRSLESAFSDGAFPPIVAVKLGEAYFVIDGHHRAALARRGGATMIDADVTELIARVPLPAGADMLEVVLRQLERIFLEDSGLADARPGVRIPVSRPAHYLELLENIQVHGYHLMRGRGRVLENGEIAADWYVAIYTPTLAAIDRLHLARRYRNAPHGDLFLVLHRHRRHAFPSSGCPHLSQTVVSVIGDGGHRHRIRVPGRGGSPQGARGYGPREVGAQPNCSSQSLRVPAATKSFDALPPGTGSILSPIKTT